MNDLDTSPIAGSVKPCLDSFSVLLSRSWSIIKNKSGVLLILAIILSIIALPTKYTTTITTTTDKGQTTTSVETSFDNQTSTIQYSTQTQDNPSISHALSYPAFLNLISPQHSFEQFLVKSSQQLSWADIQGILPAIALLCAFGLASWAVNSLIKLIALDQVSQKYTSADWAKSLNFGRLLRYIWTILLSGSLIILGLVLFIVPGIILAIWFSQASYVFINEDISGMQGLRKSREYVKGYWWQVLGRAALGLITIALTTALIAVIVGGLIVANGPSATTLAIISGIGIGIINSLGALAGQAYLYQLYVSLKQLKTT